MRASKNLPRGLIALILCLFFCGSAGMMVFKAAAVGSAAQAVPAPSHQTISSSSSTLQDKPSAGNASSGTASSLTETAVNALNAVKEQVAADGLSDTAQQAEEAAPAVAAKAKAAASSVVQSSSDGGAASSSSPTASTTLESLAQQGMAIVQDECSALGAEDLSACKAQIVARYEKTVDCQGMSDAQCQASIQSAYEDAVLYAGQRFEVIKSKVAKLDQGELSVSQLEAALNQGLSDKDFTLALKDKDTRVKVLKAIEGMALKDGQLSSSAPLAIAIDSDGDGIPDDTERRLGTDPEKADSDGDGYSDSSEILAGYNPLGEGRLQINLSAIDQALIQDQAIESPLVAGGLKQDLTVKSLQDSASDSGQGGYLLSGTADPNQVVTLYIYSDIPVITTVTTDEYGNWQYHFDQPLEDGQHEVYVAINDNTGKVVSKSQPLDFAVKEARAFTTSDTAPQPSSSASLINYYIFAALLLVLFGLLGFFYAILKQKHKF